MNVIGKTLVAAALFCGIAVASVAQATGIPVFDGSNLAQAIEQLKALSDQLKKMEEQLTTAKQQLDSLREQANTLKSLYADFSGITNHATMLANSVRDYYYFVTLR